MAIESQNVRPPASVAEAPFLDILADDFSLNSDAFRSARAASWFVRTPTGVAVIRYEDCAALLKEPRLHQASRIMLGIRGVSSGPLVDWWTGTMLNLDGAEHARLRRLVAKAFTPPMVARLRPFFRATARRLVDAFAPDGRCEFIQAFCEPYPLEGICEMLGIRPERRSAFSGWATDLGLIFATNIGEPKMRARAEAALAALYESAEFAIADHREHPGDDLLSAMIAAEAEGDRLTSEELRSIVVGLVFAGNDTTRNQTALGAIAFARFPEQWTKLRAHPELAPKAVDEMMRLFPTIGGSPRFAAEELVYRDVTFPKGTVVILLTSAGNVDDRVYGDAPFDIEANRPSPHLTFGGGIHRCLGLWLAKAEMEEALAELSERFSRIEPDGVPTWQPGLGIDGPETLPLRFISGGAGSVND